MTTDEHTIRRELENVEAHLRRITELAGRLQAERDRLIMALADSECLHDRHPVAVR